MPLNASVEDGDHFGVVENISTTTVAEVFFRLLRTDLLLIVVITD